MGGRTWEVGGRREEGGGEIRVHKALASSVAALQIAEPQVLPWSIRCPVRSEPVRGGQRHLPIAAPHRDRILGWCRPKLSHHPAVESGHSPAAPEKRLTTDRHQKITRPDSCLRRRTIRFDVGDTHRNLFGCPRSHRRGKPHLVTGQPNAGKSLFQGSRCVHLPK